MSISSYKSDLTEIFITDNMDSDAKYHSQPRCYSAEYESGSKKKITKKTKSRQKMADSAKYSAGQIVYVKKVNPRNGKFQICRGYIISSVDKGFGAISYTWSDSRNTAKTYRNWEDDIYPSYSIAIAALNRDKSLEEVIKENQQPKVTYDNLQNDKSVNDKLTVSSVYPETGTIMLKDSNGIERDECQVVDDIDTAKSDIIKTNNKCSEIEQHVNYIEKELTKEKKKRSKLVRLGIACLFGG